MKFFEISWHAVLSGLRLGSAIGLGFVGSVIIEHGMRTGYWFTSPTGPWQP